MPAHLHGATERCSAAPRHLHARFQRLLIDSGFGRGSDVLKALALGACMVLVGRPFNYAAAVADEAGVAHAIGLLRDEVDRNMAMLGVANCAKLGAQHLVRRGV